MQALLDAVVELVALVSPAKVSAIARTLRGLANSDSAPSPNTLVETSAARTAVSRLLTSWSQVEANGDVIAGMLVGASEARLRVERELSVELVWTGPTTRFVPTRRTEQVLLDLIASAKKDLFLVSFVAYDVPAVVAALNDVLHRGVRVHVLVEASTTHGGSLQVDPAAMMRTTVPTAEIFAWRDRAEPFVDGKVHAKVAVVDGVRAFITSANLTGHAMAKNMEAGVLLNGGPVPKTLAAHLQALIDVGIINRV